MWAVLTLSRAIHQDPSVVLLYLDFVHRKGGLTVRKKNCVQDDEVKTSESTFILNGREISALNF